MNDINLLLDSSFIKQYKFGDVVNVKTGFIMLEGHAKVCGHYTDDVEIHLKKNRELSTENLVLSMKTFDDNPVVSTLEIDIDQTE